MFIPKGPIPLKFIHKRPISLKFIPKGSIHNKFALVQIMVRAKRVTGQYLNQRWLSHWCNYVSPGLNMLKKEWKKTNTF